MYDLETTGLDWKKDEAVEIGVMRVIGDQIEKRTWLLKPTVAIAPEAAAITGITDAYVQEHGRDPAECWMEFALFCGLNRPDFLPLVGHNILRFDNFFVAEALRKHELLMNWPYVSFFDTAALYKGDKLKMKPNETETFHEWANRVLATKAFGLKYNLVSVFQELGGSMVGLEAHRADADVFMTDFVYRALTKPPAGTL